jgi:acetylornithine deacetylase
VSEVAELLAELVAIDSVNPDLIDGAAGEIEIARFVAAWLERAALDVDVVEARDGRPSVIGRTRGNGRTLLLNGHVDTVGVEGMEAPFSARLEGGRLYGRGAVDDKACVTAMLLALRELRDDPPPLDVTLVAAVDEEYQFRGILHHLRGSTALGAIAGEVARDDLSRHPVLEHMRGGRVVGQRP